MNDKYQQSCSVRKSWQLKHSIWSTRAVLVSTCPFFTFYPSFHHPSADALACFHPIITFHFALWCEGRNKWKAAAFSSGGKQSVQKHKVLICRSHLRASLSFPLLCSSFSTPGRPEEQMLKQCSHSGADLIGKRQLSGQNSQTSGFYVTINRNMMVYEELGDLWRTSDISRTIKMCVFV